MIKYNNNTINDWNFGASNIKKVYRNGAVVYYKVNGSSPSFYTLQELIDTHTVVTVESNGYTLSPKVSGITYFRLYVPNATTKGSYVFTDLNADNATSTTKFAIKGDASGSLYMSVGGYSTIKGAADSASCQWAYWVDENTMEVDVVAAVGTTVFINKYQSNFPTQFISFKFD